MTALALGSDPRAKQVEFTDRQLIVEISDQRVLAVPLAWYPRLAEATAEERAYWMPIRHGSGILWPALDEHITVEALLAGRRSSESEESFQAWMAQRRARGTFAS